MPTATVPGFLVDAFGRPAIFGGGATLYRRNRDDDRLRPQPPNHFADYATLLDPSNYRRLVSECRSLASRGLVAALLEQKADYVAASHFRPRFTGHDSKWGAAALEALTSALKICNLRGPRFGWRDSWRLAIPTRATDGRFFVLLTTWGDTGWPALQFLEGHRVGQRDNSNKLVGANDTFTRSYDEAGKLKTIRGAYRGLLIDNGVIYNEDGTEVAYRVLGAKPEQDEDISARDMIQVARPQRYSEGSTPPELARAYLDFLALDAAQTAQLDQQVNDSKLTVVETNETGRQDPNAMLTGMAPQRDNTPTEMVDRGMWRYVKSGSGKLEPFKSDRPSDQWMNFDQRVAARAAAAIRWRVEMLDPTALRGAATRAFQDQINTAIADEFSIIEPHACRVLGYFVSKLTKLGVIAPSAEWMCWGIAPPPWFEVDRNSARIDLEEVGAGRVSMSTLHQRDGRTTIEVLTDRATSYELALEVQKDHPEVPLAVILGDQGATAGKPAAAAAQPHAEPDGDEGMNDMSDDDDDEGEKDDEEDGEDDK